VEQFEALGDVNSFKNLAFPLFFNNKTVQNKKISSLLLD